MQTYSGGMRRRIDIAASLVAIPEILFLDEPTTGLDPRSRNQVWELVRRIAAEGTAVLKDLSGNGLNAVSACGHSPRRHEGLGGLLFP